MRYAVEFLAPLFPSKRVRTFLDRLRNLPDHFGYHMDIAVAREQPMIVPTHCARDPAVHKGTTHGQI